MARMNQINKQVNEWMNKIVKLSNFLLNVSSLYLQKLFGCVPVLLMRPPFSRSVYGVLWCCARFRQISLISRFSGCSGWARASSLASEPLLSHLTFPVHTSLLSSSHASSTLLTLIRDNHSLIDGTNYLRLKRVQKYPVTETRQVSILCLSFCAAKVGHVFFLILVWPERFCRSAIIVSLFSG